MSAATTIKNSLARKPRSVVPEAALKCFTSENSYDATNVLISCRFSPESNASHLLALSDEEGFVSIVDVGAKDLRNTKTWQAHENACMDVCWVPKKCNELLTLSGDESATLWDVETGAQLNDFRAHRSTVRCASFAPDDPHCFATGARDGAVIVWDTRTRNRRHSDSDGISTPLPVDSIANAHVVDDSIYKPSLVRQGRKSKKSTHRMSVGSTGPLPSVTGLLHYDNHTIVSASSSSKSGIRFWDLRKSYNHKAGHPVPIRTLRFPERKKLSGVTSLCFNRYKSSLFAAATDSIVYEYAVCTSNDKPVCQYEGAVIESFYVQIDVCHSADFLICGSAKESAVIWDLQEGRGGEPVSSRLPYPKFSLQGHNNEVTGVSWSQNMEWIATCDDVSWRLWSMSPTASLRTPATQEEANRRAVATEYNLPSFAATAKKIESMALTPKSQQLSSPSTVSVKSSQEEERGVGGGVGTKRKLPFQSPFKSPSSAIFSEKENRSPLKKMSKRLFSPPPVTVSAANSNNPFYYSCPTENLPNFVIEQAQRSPMTEVKSPMPNRKKLSDWLLKEPIGQKQLSPRKLTLRPKSTQRRSSARTILDFFGAK
uniref:Denticleless n=1 Tax=Plectus sambesii TaxID=2011161 RepID=A0A914X284_9BILA